MEFRRVVNSVIMGGSTYTTTTIGYHSIRLDRLYIQELTNPRPIINSVIMGVTPYPVTHIGPLPNSQSLSPRMKLRISSQCSNHLLPSWLRHKSPLQRVQDSRCRDSALDHPQVSQTIQTSLYIMRDKPLPTERLNIPHELKARNISHREVQNLLYKLKEQCTCILRLELIGVSRLPTDRKKLGLPPRASRDKNSLNLYRYRVWEEFRPSSPHACLELSYTPKIIRIKKA